MDFFADALPGLIGPFLYPVLGTRRIYWVYLVTALVLAYVAWRLAAPGGREAGGPRRPGERLRGFLAYALPAEVYGHPSARVDYLYFFVHKASYAVFLTPLLVGAAVVARATEGVLGGIFGAATGGLEPAVGATAAYTLLSLLAFDGAIFAAHYAQPSTRFRCCGSSTRSTIPPRC